MGGRSGKIKISRLHHELETSLSGQLATLSQKIEWRKKEKKGVEEQMREGRNKGRERERWREGRRWGRWWKAFALHRMSRKAKETGRVTLFKPGQAVNKVSILLRFGEITKEEILSLSTPQLLVLHLSVNRHQSARVPLWLTVFEFWARCYLLSISGLRTLQ